MVPKLILLFPASVQPSLKNLAAGHENINILEQFKKLINNS